MADSKSIAALWAFDESGRLPPQFVAAAAEGLRDSWYEESERLREDAERWFIDFGDGDDGPWRFAVVYQQVPVPTVPAEQTNRV